MYSGRVLLRLLPGALIAATAIVTVSRAIVLLRVARRVAGLLAQDAAPAITPRARTIVVTVIGIMTVTAATARAAQTLGKPYST